jgi:hypothetical protein
LIKALHLHRTGLSHSRLFEDVGNLSGGQAGEESVSISLSRGEEKCMSCGGRGEEMKMERERRKNIDTEREKRCREQHCRVVHPLHLVAYSFPLE